MTKKKFGFGVMAAGAALLAAGPVMAHPGGHHTHLWSTGNESVKVAEAPARGRSVLSHAPRSRSAQAYRELAVQLMEPLAKKRR